MNRTCILAAAVALIALPGCSFGSKRDFTLTGAEVARLLEQPDAIFSVSFSPNDRLLAVACRISGVRVLDVESGSLLRSFAVPGGDKLSEVHFLEDGKRIVSSSYDHPEYELRIWDTDQDEALHKFGDQAHAYGGTGGYLQSISLSPDGKHLADSRFRVWDLETLESTSLPGEEWSSSVRYSPDGTALAFATKNAVELWNVETRTKTASLDHIGVVDLAFSPDGTQLVSVGRGEGAVVWDVATGSPLTTLEGHSGTVLSVAFHPGGRFLATGGNDESVWLWDLSSGEAVQVLQDHGGAVRALTFSHDGELLAAGSYQGSLLVVWKLLSE